MRWILLLFGCCLGGCAGAATDPTFAAAGGAAGEAIGAGGWEGSPGERTVAGAGEIDWGDDSGEPAAALPASMAEVV